MSNILTLTMPDNLYGQLTQQAQTIAKPITELDVPRLKDAKGLRFVCILDSC